MERVIKCQITRLIFSHHTTIPLSTMAMSREYKNTRHFLQYDFPLFFSTTTHLSDRVPAEFSARFVINSTYLRSAGESVSRKCITIHAHAASLHANLFPVVIRSLQDSKQETSASDSTLRRAISKRRRRDVVTHGPPVPPSIFPPP